MKSGRRRDLPRRTLMLESATAFGDDGSKVQAGGAGLGASVKTSRRCDRSMSEHAAHNLILARPRIEENLATGVPEQMRVKSEASVTEHCPAKLHRQRSGRFCLAAFAGEQGIGWLFQQGGSILTYIPGQDLDGLRRQLKINRLSVFRLILADHKVESSATCDKIIREAKTRQVLQSDWRGLQKRDCGRHLSQNRIAARIALCSFNLSTDALWQAEEVSNSPSVVEGA